MQHARFAPLLLGLIAALPSCATAAAPGYGSSAGYAGASCADAAVTQALNEATEHYLEQETGFDIKGYGPSGQDMFFGLTSAFFSALAEDRPPGLADACAGVQDAQAATFRRARYPY